MDLHDWEKIEKEYRAGQLSIREISRQFDVPESTIRKKMKHKGVTRDLSATVAQRVRTESCADVRSKAPRSEEENVDSSVSRGVEVVRGHQRRISQGNRVVETLFEQLNEVIDNREEVEEAIIEETRGEDNPKRRNMMLRAVALQSNAATTNSLSLALKNLITLERETFNLDADKEDAQTRTLQDMVKMLDGKSTGPTGNDSSD